MKVRAKAATVPWSPMPSELIVKGEQFVGLIMKFPLLIFTLN